jgi:Skp family chaperone for outer membrane proteins
MSTADAKPVPPAYQLATVPKVEVFASGTYRGKTYTDGDLDEVVRYFNDLGPAGRNLLVPIVVIGHEETQDFLDRTDLPSAGAVANLRRVGSSLFADFVDVPLPIASLIRSKAYRKVSVELYDHDRPFNTGTGEVIGGKILRRIALLGGEIPQVKTLADLPVPVFSYSDDVRADSLITIKPTNVIQSQTRGTYYAFSEVGSHMNRDDLLNQLKAILPTLDQTVIDTLTDEQLAGLCAAAPAPAPTEMADFDRAAAIAELVAKGGDATELEAKTDDELKALLAPPVGDAGQNSDDPEKKKDDKPMDTFSEKQKAALKENQRLVSELEAANKRAQESLAIRRKNEAEAFCDRLVSEGRLAPVHKPTILETLVKLDDVAPTHQFSENGKTVKVTSYEAKRRELSGWPVLHTMGERLKQSGNAKTTDDEAELEKVKRFAEDRKSDLAAAGKTPEKYIHTFSEFRKKDPSLTAAKFGVPAEYCN